MTQLLTDPALKGKVTLLSEMRDTVGLVLLDQGKDPSNFTEADFKAAIAMIQKAKDAGQIQKFTGNDYTDGLSAGDIAACVAWSGDVASLSLDAPELELHPPRGRLHAVVRQLRHPGHGQAQEERREAHQLLLRPQGHGARSRPGSTTSPRSTGTKDAVAAIDPDLAANQLIFPSTETLSKAKKFRDLTAKEESEYTRMFTDLATG